jgi:hypothetical protein
MGRAALSLVVLLAAAGAPLCALAEFGTDPQASNERRLEKIRQDPKEYARLCEEVQRFLALPPERQDALRLLDRGLHDEPKETASRLNRALDRYSWWYEHLSQDDRRRIEQAADSVARLQVIRQIRQAQWVERLPRAIREQLARLQGEARDKRINDLRIEERKRRQQWQTRFQQWQQGAQQQWQRSFRRWYQSRTASGPQPPADALERVLLRLALRELGAEDRARLRLSAGDATSWDRLQQEFIKRHPDEWRALVGKTEAKPPSKP